MRYQGGGGGGGCGGCGRRRGGHSPGDECLNICIYSANIVLAQCE